MLGYLLDPENQEEDPLLRSADCRGGAWSILTGVAANRSMESGKSILIEDLVPDIPLPDYPPMPTAEEALSLQGEES